MNEDIITEFKRRKITSLIHFTQTTNLYRMLEEPETGIRPRSELPTECVAINDAARYDGTSHVNLSIGSPNRRMFWVFRQRQLGKDIARESIKTDWVVIAIHPDVLKEVSCAFTRGNAARHDEEKRAGVEGFRQLFDSETASQPADSQAECLVEGHIPVRYWQAIYVPDERVQGNVQRYLSWNDLNPDLVIIKPEIFQ